MKKKPCAAEHSPRKVNAVGCSRKDKTGASRMDKTVVAVKDVVTIKKIETLLRSRWGDTYADAWRLGVNVGLRASDLVKLRYDDVRDECLYIQEQKTGKPRRIKLNAQALATIRSRRLRTPASDEWIFQSRRGGHIASGSLNKPFPDISKKVGMHLGTHSMRKTFGHAVYNATGNIDLVADILNHSSIKQTRRYIGLEWEEHEEAYDALNL